MEAPNDQNRNMDLSFVLLTWNSASYIENCLNLLLRDLNDNHFTYEIFVIDNGSVDQTVDLLASFKDRYPEHIFPIYLDRNTGTTYSRNLALKKVRGRFIIIMDSDVEIGSGAIEHLVETLIRYKKAGIVVPRLVYPSGKLQKSSDVFPTIFTKLYRYFFLRRVEDREALRRQEEHPHEVDYAISAVWVLRNELLDQVGLLDENIFYAPEDVDYCLRVWKAGYTIIYDPSITCVHHTQEISRGLKINKSTLRHIQGLSYYFCKHGYILRRPRHVNSGYVR